MRRLTVAVSFVLLCSLAAPLLAAGKTIHLQVAAPKSDQSNVPLKASVTVPKELADVTAVQLSVGDKNITGQLTAPGLLSETSEAADGEVARELHFIAPALKAGEAVNVEAIVSTDGPKPAETFAWGKDDGTHIDLTSPASQLLDT